MVTCNLQEIDLAIVPMVISTVRSIAQDFTQAYYYEPSVVGYKRSKPQDKMDIYAKPFKPNVSEVEPICTISVKSPYGKNLEYFLSNTLWNMVQQYSLHFPDSLYFSQQKSKNTTYMILVTLHVWLLQLCYVLEMSRSHKPACSLSQIMDLYSAWAR